MYPQKKKDIMSDAFDSFWQSGSTSQPTKSPEDENWDAFWKRGNYSSTPQTTPQGSQYVKTIMPVEQSITVQQGPPQQNNSQTSLTQKQRYDLIKETQKQKFDLYKQKLKYQQAMANRNKTAGKRAGNVLGGLVKTLVQRSASTGNKYTTQASKGLTEKLKSTKAYQGREDYFTAQNQKKKEELKVRAERLKGIKEGITNQYKPQAKKAYVGGYNN